MDERPSSATLASIEATLLPCPHCGPMPAMPELVLSDVSSRWQVFCGPCGSSSGSSREPAQAADSWNSRASAGPSIPHSSPALVPLALLLGNSLRDLSPSEDPPRFGFRGDDEQIAAFGLARAVVALLNRQIGERANRVADERVDAT